MSSKARGLGLLSKGVILLHDKVCAHSAAPMATLLKNFHRDIFLHSLYLLDFALYDSHLFPTLKMKLGGKDFGMINEIEKFVSMAGCTLIAKYAKTIVKCEKQKVYSVVFRITFFAFCSSLRQGRYSSEKSKDFVVYFFVALIKHEIRMK